MFDERWEGQHGIGRFACELRGQLSQSVPAGAMGSPLSVRGLFSLTKRLQSLKGGVFVTPGFNSQLFSSEQCVHTIHDLIHLRFPDERSWGKRIFYQALLKPHLLKSRLTLTVSEFSKRELLEWSGLREEQVVVVGNGVSDAFSPAGPKKTLPFPFLLYVGNSKPHKNLFALLKAFSRVVGELEHKLVLVTRSDDALLRELSRLKLGERCVIVSSLDDVELAAYYRSAECLVFPSLYEGFGLPAIEAMACGCPVLASNCASLPEIVGNAGVLFDASNRESFAGVIHAVCRSEIAFETMCQVGLKRAEACTWDNVGIKTRFALNQAYGLALA